MIAGRVWRECDIMEGIEEEITRIGWLVAWLIVSLMVDWSMGWLARLWVDFLFGWWVD